MSRLNPKPALTTHVPEDSSEHARCLQSDFDAVDQYLKPKWYKPAPRQMFDNLYRSYSKLHAKLQLASANDTDNIARNSFTAEDHMSRLSPKPALTTDFPEDSSEHARCLQSDFDAVDQYLKCNRNKAASRKMFDKLYRSYSKLHKKLQPASAIDLNSDVIQDDSLQDKDLTANIVVMKIQSAKAKDRLKSLEPAELDKIVWAALDGHDKDLVVGATVGASSNINISLITRQAMKTLLLDKSWQANLRRRLVPKAYRIQMVRALPRYEDFITKKGRSLVIDSLAENNYNGMLERCHIRRVDLCYNVLTPQQRSVVVTFTTAEAANLALKGGLKWQSKLHKCLRFPGDEFVEQCYRCQAYEYNEAECLGDLHCANCAMTHCTLDCEVSSRKCMLCGGKHASTDPVCPLRATREAKAKQRNLGVPFVSRESSRRYSHSPIVTEKPDATTSLLRDRDPKPSRNNRIHSKKATSLNAFSGTSNDPLQQSNLNTPAPMPLGLVLAKYGAPQGIESSEKIPNKTPELEKIRSGSTSGKLVLFRGHHQKIKEQRAPRPTLHGNQRESAGTREDS